MDFDLVQIFFTEVSIVANPEHDSNGKRDGTKLSFNFSLEPTGNDPKIAYAELRIQTVENESENPPYEMSVSACALITSLTDSPLNIADINIRKSAIQMLMGSAREMILTITGRGPWSRFCVTRIPFDQIDGLTKEATPE